MRFLLTGTGGTDFSDFYQKVLRFSHVSEVSFVMKLSNFSLPELKARHGELLAEAVEVWNEIQKLEKLETAIQIKKEISITFNEANRTISWRGGQIHLSKNRYMLVKTIWQNEKRRASITKIEESVWGKDGFTEIGTMRKTIEQTKNLLQSAAFPYKLITIKKDKMIVGAKLK